MADAESVIQLITVIVLCVGNLILYLSSTVD
jgi:hypothetical protein